MTQLLHYMTGLSTFVKVGWICWLAATIAQIAWFRVVHELPEAPEVPEPAFDDRSTGWPPISATRHTSLFGVSHVWEPEPASGPSLESIDFASTPSPDSPPSGWVELASDISPTIDEPSETRRPAKRRRRSVAPSIA